ncbi:response regulator [Dasania sp. GY-MA-18]|uniref:Response regulator n=1 Tax=Dasania phycosphaerae TaxID=2950436 RepID=A0A9J6RJU6_9GAMM|nr:MULTISPECIES: response regulator [Dasania]MCR8922035.1 response regulator [Dasania sp. GY-MA-18]MCZ0864463.1 response regulator [Dasania phycosphaerae]MCZ0868191.1 response regulator [Dasania phycosphaerae]
MKGLKILVVDDASFIREMLKKNLRSCFPGCEVSDANNGRKAQSMIKINRFDLILCDWEMPEMSGEELLRWVRGNESTAELPFIMVTSRGEKDFIIKAVQAGVSEYIGKPFSPETLAKKVSKTLKKAGFKVPEAKKATPGLAGESVDLLTAGSKPAASSNNTKAAASDSLSALMGGAAAAPAPARKKSSKKTAVARGQAQIHFAGFSSQCVISSITLQTLAGAIKREEQLPTVLEPVVISIVQNDGEDVARLNGYVHSIQAAENRIDANVLKLGIRFVDDDPVKLEQLSRYIATF